MLLKIRDDLLAEWVTEAQIANLSYFRVRREVYQSFLQALDASKDAAEEDCTTLSADDFFTIKQVLTVRNEGLGNDARLAFDRLLTELS